MQVVVDTNCRSAGDALRALDQKALMEDDFVLVSGDVISNLDIAGVVREHQARKAKDSNAIMTMVGACAAPCRPAQTWTPTEGWRQASVSMWCVRASARPACLGAGLQKQAGGQRWARAGLVQALLRPDL